MKKLMLALLFSLQGSVAVAAVTRDQTNFPDGTSSVTITVTDDTTGETTFQAVEYYDKDGHMTGYIWLDLETGEIDHEGKVDARMTQMLFYFNSLRKE